MTPMMQRFELSSTDMDKLLTRGLLLIERQTILYTGLPNKCNETGKRETLSRTYLCLAHIPLELDDDELVHLKMEHLS